MPVIEIKSESIRRLAAGLRRLRKNQPRVTLEEAREQARKLKSAQRMGERERYKLTKKES